MSVFLETSDAVSFRQAITAAYRRDEARCVEDLVASFQSHAPDAAVVGELARRLALAARDRRLHARGVDRLMHEFSLSSREGVALMCLAEALLRVPDAATAERLIRDRVTLGDWQAHVSREAPLFVNAAAWGLMLTGRLMGPHDEKALPGVLASLLARGSEPFLRRAITFAMQKLGQQFVIGRDIDDALTAGQAHIVRGYAHSFDMLGEAAVTQEDADRYTADYEQAIHAIGRTSHDAGVRRGPGISVKLSALHPRYTPLQHARVLHEMLPRVQRLAALARQYDLGFNIDAEEAERLDLSLDVFEHLIVDPSLGEWDGLGFVAQAYQKRCPFVIDHLIGLARGARRRIMLRLVKGAYWDTEIKRAQQEGAADYAVFTRKAHTDLSFLACAAKMLDAADVIFPQFATHNAHTVASVWQMARERGVADYEFQCLHGMGEALYDNVVGADALGKQCRIYAPVGHYDTLLPYLVRRLLENGANSSFVHQLVNPDVNLDDLVADPLDTVRRESGAMHPRIPLPRDLYGAGRRNSRGLDLSSAADRSMLDDALGGLAGRRWAAAPIVAGVMRLQGERHEVRNPARPDDIVGDYVAATTLDVNHALAVAEEVAPHWAAISPARRAAYLRRVADTLESRREELISLCIREAGKTRADGIAEVREAVDFCRYYAMQIERLAPSAHEGGIVACISPWNFPLSIFVGQIAAALAAGYVALAKPAEQTPLMATLVVGLFHASGIEGEVLQLLPGAGPVVGMALVKDARVKGVLFTGSGEAAAIIDRALSLRPQAFLVAETGGVNAMIVDSSALPEQVVADVMASGFGSAGQRCSSLRVLCVQEDVADRVCHMLREAMRELVVGDPAQLATDIGPLIDATARARVEAHVANMRACNHDVFRTPLPEGLCGHFAAPALVAIGDITELPGEVFGPVVHILRFAQDRMEQTIDAINAAGYGLTFGLHSRIGARIDLVRQRVRAGNLYVNRNMIGAVVGVQPFGGEGLSGTGPKAGGPFILHRLLGREQVEPDVLSLAMTAGEPLPAEFCALEAWAAMQGMRDLAGACVMYRSLSLIAHRIDLPGPTGEANTLYFAPRGKLLCVADHAATLLRQIAAAWATGNDVALTEGAAANAVVDMLPASLRTRIAVYRQVPDDVAGLLLDTEEDSCRAWRERLSAREGARVAVVMPGADGHYPLYRLVTERVLSVNTTAAGGNASLMALDA